MLMKQELRTCWHDYLRDPSFTQAINLRVDLTLKQRRSSGLRTRRPSTSARVRYPATYSHTYVETDGCPPVKRYAPPVVDDRKTVNVRVGTCRAPLRDAHLYAPYYYLTDDEVRRIALRLMNRLNKSIFGNRARRRGNPERLTAMICQHDRGTRRHLHCLFAVPPTVQPTRFMTALREALATEPFVYRAESIELVRDLSGSITYNANESKSLAGSPILYLYPQLHQPKSLEIHSCNSETTNDTFQGEPAHEDHDKEEHRRAAEDPTGLRESGHEFVIPDDRPHHHHRC